MDTSTYVRPSRETALELARETDLSTLMRRAAELRDAGFGRPVSYSRKVFIPLTKLCRDVCHYCTFAQSPRPGERAYMTLDEVVGVARRGAEAGCREALFTLGDKPESRYPQARAELGRARLSDDDRLPGGRSPCRVRRQRSVASRQPRGRHAGRAAGSARGVPVAGDDAGKRLPAAAGARTGPPRLARQGPGRAPGDAADGGGAGDSLHLRHSDRHRRNPRRAHRIASGAARPARRARARTGDHRPELPGQAGHADGGRARAAARGSAVDDRLRAVDLRSRHADPGAAQPDPGPFRGPDPRRHQRLGRRVAGDAGPRQSGGAVAAPGGAGARDRARGQGADRAADGLSGLREAARRVGGGAAPAGGMAGFRCRGIRPRERLVTRRPRRGSCRRRC